MSAKLLPLLAAVSIFPLAAHAEPPRALPHGATVELVASEPDIRTPTAVAVDPRGRVWILENNTHFRPKTYDAPPTDRVIVLDDFAPDGRAQKIHVYADGFRDGMGLLLLPNGDVIVSTRAETVRLRDTDNDGTADERKTLLRLETTDTYPHNGLSGIAQAPNGKLYLGLGENHGAAWTLTGSDGVELRGTDEGAVFQIDVEGRGLTWWALGVWNPFGLAFDPAGRLFALDNDPGGGSLCRLLHIVRGGDYGYRYRYGRTTDHPFISWDGRLPGTLPMICYSGEAPTGLLWRGDALLGCTWTDHAVQRFPLTPRGGSFSSRPEVLVQGDRDFRPSGIATAPDGTLLISDWADGSYDLHGKGRVWRVRGLSTAAEKALPVSKAEATTTKWLAGKLEVKDAWAAFWGEDPFLYHAALRGLAEMATPKDLLAHTKDPNPKVRVGALLALRLAHRAVPGDALKVALKDPDPGVRRAALQWIGEEQLKEFAPLLSEAISGQPTRQLFEAYLAAVEQFARTKMEGDEKVGAKARYQTMAEIVLDPQRPMPLRALALRLLPADHQALTLDTLTGLLLEPDVPLRVEAVRVLATRADAGAQSLLRKISLDPHTPDAVRADAVAGLALSSGEAETRNVLTTLLEKGEPAISREAARSLGQPVAPQAESVAGRVPDIAAGRRLFFHPNGPLCGTCHQIEGRGRAIGPDLSGIWRLTPEQILEAIREPSKEIAPAFVQWHVQFKDGREAMGIDQFVDSKSDFTLLDATGKRTKYPFADVTLREQSPVSMMPPGLLERFSEKDRADLIAYLRASRE